MPPKRELITRWADCDIVTTDHDDITGGVEWRSYENEHVVIVHRGGRMDFLETELNSKGKSFGPANAGEIWIVPAGQKYAASAKGAWIDYSVISLRSDAIGDDSTGINDSSEILAMHGYRDPYCLQAVNKLAACAQAGDDVSRIVGEMISTSLHLHLCEKYRVDKKRASSLSTPLLNEFMVRTLREYIYTNLDEVLTLAELSKLAGMTTHNFLKAFRFAFGTTPAQYIIMQRLRRAQWLLSHAKSDIVEIAYATGFASHSHMTASFKKHLGMSPTEYRKTGGGFGDGAI